jgi:putative membrane protein
MPSEARRLHGFTVVSRTLRLSRRLLLPAIVGGAGVGDDVTSVLLWVFVILAVPSLVIAAAQWVVFRYRLDAEELIIDSGVLARRRRVIPVDRIQNVDLEQSALERLAGVAELRIETASGGRETEASLTVLSVAEARALQVHLLEQRSARRSRAVDGLDGDPAGDPAQAPSQARLLLRLSPADLVLAGATSNEAGLIAAGLATMLEVASRFGALEWAGAWVDEAVAAGAGVGFVGAAVTVALLVVAFLILGWVVSIVAMVVRYHGFTLSRSGDDLIRSYGLLSRHHTTVPLERVQAARVEETLLRRAFGLAALKIETAGAGPQDQRGAGGGAEAYVPIARIRDVGPLLRQVFEDARFEDVALQPVAPPSRRREFIRLAGLVALATAALTFLAGQQLLALILLSGPAWILARARYRARGWDRAAGYMVTRSGVLTRTTWIIPERKIQTLHMSETPFQRRWNLATLLVDTAAGGRAAAVVDLYRHAAEPLMEELASGSEAARLRASRRAVRARALDRTEGGPLS